MPEGIEEGGRVATINFLDAVTLTGTFSDNESEAYQVSPFAQLELIFDYTMDATETNNTAQIRILLSEDGTNYHEYSIAGDAVPSGGIVLATLYPRRFVLTGSAGVKVTSWYALPTSAKFIKIQAAETGLVSVGGVLTAKARVSNNVTRV